MINNEQTSRAALLNEILPVPSEKIMTDRFSVSEEAQSADCSGKCASGVCRTFV